MSVERTRPASTTYTHAPQLHPNFWLGSFQLLGWIFIVLISAAASNLGSASGLAWMMQMLNRKKPLFSSPLNLERRWAWIILGFSAALLYGLIFGPTVRL